MFHANGFWFVARRDCLCCYKDWPANMETNSDLIRSLYISGATRKRIRRETAATNSEICRAVADLPRRRHRLTREQIAFIQECNGTVREVAAQLGVGKSSVFYWRQKVYDAWMLEDETPDDSTVEFLKLDVPRQCSRHGRIAVWPCVQCMALGLSDYE